MPQSRPIVAFASDHAGFALLSFLKKHLEESGAAVLDLGMTGDQPLDYPDVAATMARALWDRKADVGVIGCGTGIGVSMAINRYAHVRAALVHDAFGARLARRHNDANVLALGGRTTGPEVAKDCLDVFLSTPFEGGRHAARVEKMNRAPEPWPRGTLSASERAVFKAKFSA